MSTLTQLKKTAQQLQALARSPAQLGGYFTRTMARNVRDVEPLQDIERALTLMTQDEPRHLAATCLYRFLDVHRVWMGDMPLPEPSCSVYTACVPFTLKDLRIAQSLDMLATFTAPLDPKMASGPRDAPFPSHLPIVLAVPLVGMDIVERWAYSFMLANSHHDTPVDQLYAEAWAKFTRQQWEPEQAVFAFLFSMAVPGRPSSNAPGPQPVNLPVTPWAEHMLDLLMGHAQALNAQHPEMGMQLHALTSLSEAVEMASDLRMKAMFAKTRTQVGAPVRISADTKNLHGFSDAFVEDLQRQLDEEQPSKTDEDMFHEVSLGQVTCLVDDNPAEFCQVNLFSGSGQLTLSMSVQVPLGTLPAQALGWWRMLDTRGLARVIQHPTEHLADNRLLRDGCVRDQHGQWVERELLNWGPGAQSVFKTAKWSSAFGRDSFGSNDPEDLERHKHYRDHPYDRPTVPDVFERIPLMQAVQAHYQPAVLQALKVHLAMPGQPRRRAFRALAEQFEPLERVSLHDSFHAFLSSSMWAALHFEQSKGVVYRVDPSVQEQMALTNVEKRFPVQLLHSPFPDIYLHLLQRNAYEAPGVPKAWLDGAYVQERPLTAEECEAGQCAPGTRELTLTFALNDEQAQLSMTYPAITLVIGPEDDRDLAQMLRDAIEGMVEKGPDERLGPQGQRMSVEQWQYAAKTTVQQPLLDICKLLLYISIPEARLSKDLRRTELLKQARQASGRDKQRLFDRAAKARDVVVVGPLPPMEFVNEDGSPAEGHRSLRPHPRQGYVRAQPWGEGHKLRRPKWIAPVMVNAHKLSGDTPDPKPRKVV